ncbi:MAG TPA: hypothetical protein VNK95_16875 [Caldilineaceae bacterium]|nr:hypothetical protein [Caldilineaceae bacterium]
MPYTSRTTVKEVLTNPKARAVVERHLPGATNHPLIHEAMYMTLGEVALYPESGLNQQKLEAILADLNQLET